MTVAISIACCGEVDAIAVNDLVRRARLPDYLKVRFPENGRLGI